MVRAPLSRPRLRTEENFVGSQSLRVELQKKLGGAEAILLLVNHLSGASTVSVLLDHASLGQM